MSECVRACKHGRVTEGRREGSRAACSACAQSRTLVDGLRPIVRRRAVGGKPPSHLASAWRVATVLQVQLHTEQNRRATVTSAHPHAPHCALSTPHLGLVLHEGYRGVVPTRRHGYSVVEAVGGSSRRRGCGAAGQRHTATTATLDLGQRQRRRHRQVPCHGSENREWRHDTVEAAVARRAATPHEVTISHACTPQYLRLATPLTDGEQSLRV